MQASCRPSLLTGVWRLVSGLRHALLLGFVALFLAACSTKFLYNKLDTFIIWKLNGFVSLTGEQKEALKADLQTHLDSVRLNDLPRFAALAETTAREVEAGPVTAEQIDRRYIEVLDAYDQFMFDIVPLAERFLRSLSDEQIEEFFANLDEINDEMYEDYSGRTAEEREKNRNKSALRGIGEFTGRLTDEQEFLITDALARMDDASVQWIDYQRIWQERFRALVTEKPPLPEYRAELTALFVYPRNLHSDEYRRIVDGNRAILNDMLSELLSGLSERQRARTVKKLDGYVELLTGLAEAG